MSLKKLSLAVSLAALLAGPAFADGGPIPEPIPEEPAPPPAEEPTPPPPAPEPESWLRPAFYLGVGGGAVWLRDIDGLTGDLVQCDEPEELVFHEASDGVGRDICPIPPTDSPEQNPDGFTTDAGMGWGIFGTAGFRFGYGLRSELEFGYREADISDFITDAPFFADAGLIIPNGNAAAPPDAGDIVGDDLLSDGDPLLIADGRTETVSLMLNVLYDFEVSPHFIPYIGGGIGGAHTRISFEGEIDFEGRVPNLLRELYFLDEEEELDSTLINQQIREFDNRVLDDEGWAFAWQLIGGVTMPLRGNTELFVDYRYLNTKGFDLDFGGLVEEHDEYVTHTVMAGFRYSFR